jgi:hypothetical protein
VIFGVLFYVYGSSLGAYRSQLFRIRRHGDFQACSETEYIHVLQKEAAKKGRNIEDAFGKEATRASYAIRSKVLNLTPSDVNLFSSPQEIKANAAMLVIKGAESKSYERGLYSFQTSWMRGFQEGDLSRDKSVLLEAFDNQDRLLTLIVSVKLGKSYNFFASPLLLARFPCLLRGGSSGNLAMFVVFTVALFLPVS